MALQMIQQGTTESPFIGIDFGTSTTRVAVPRGDGAALLPDLAGETAIPSLLALSPQGGVLTGSAAGERQLLFPHETLQAPKSLLCLGGDELAGQEVFFPHVITEPGAVLQIEIGGRPRTAAELVALYLADLRRNVEILREAPVRSAVLTVPVDFSPFDRQVLRLAAQMAGFRRVRVIDDPTAAALAWVSQGGRGRAAVCCWGAEHFSASIVQANSEIVRIQASVGAKRLGGNSIDQALATDFLERVRASLSAEPQSEAHLARYALVAAEKAKRDLFAKAKVEIRMPLAGQAKPFKHAYKKGDLAGWVAPLSARVSGLCDTLQKMAGIERGSCDALILCGGLTQSPLLRETLQQAFDCAPLEGLDPEEAVARGALARGRYLDRAAELPLVLDAIPAAYGLEGPGGQVEAILGRGVTIPASKIKTFTTYLDQQTSVGVQLFSQSELEWQPLAQVQLSKATPMKAGQPAIEVTFLADEDGVVSVEAREVMRGKKLEAELHPVRGLSSAQVRATLESLTIEPAEDFAAGLRRSLKERASFLLRSVRDAARRHTGKMTRDEKQIFAKKIKEMEELLDAGEVAEIREALRELEAVAIPLKARILGTGLQPLLR